MRTIVALLSPALSIALYAQVQNGSFENAGAFDPTGWTWQCTPPGPVMPGAPGCGDYAARKPFSNTQGCLFEHMTQYITTATWGDVFTLSGWVMRESGPFSAAPGLYFASDSLGVVVLKNGITTSNTTWTWLQVTDTVYPSALTSPMVLLHTGLVGGPGFGWSRFDGIELQNAITSGLDDASRPALPWRIDADHLHVHVADRTVHETMLLDAAGRILPVRMERTGTTLVVDLAGLDHGLHLLRVQTPEEVAVLRFVNP